MKFFILFFLLFQIICNQETMIMDDEEPIRFKPHKVELDPAKSLEIIKNLKSIAVPLECIDSEEITQKEYCYIALSLSAIQELAKKCDL